MIKNTVTGIFCKSTKLVDASYAVYKLLSFQVHLDGLPFGTIEKAEDLLEEKGRYPLFHSLSSVTQFL
ncbi:TPA: hypothetical protein ACGU4V_002651 [Vibrio vulnificus]